MAGDVEAGESSAYRMVHQSQFDVIPEFTAEMVFVE